MADSSSGAGWRQKSTGFLAGIAAIVLVVVLVGGMAIGYEIQKSRTHDKKTTTPTTKKNNNALKAAGKSVRFTGTVSGASATSITVTPKTGAKRKISVLKNTTVMTADAGAAGDIASSVKVLYAPDGSLTKAKAVIVLPKASKVGSAVSSADGGSMTLKGAKNKSVKITTTGASVSKTSKGSASDIKDGSKVMVVARKTKAGAFYAVEIIILPNDSPFA